MRRSSPPTVRVGLLVLVALALLGAAVFLIGEQQKLFRPMNHYWIAFDSASGLQAGNPVQLNGVSVGRVEDVVLPEDPSIHQLRVKIAVDSRYAARIRKDSEARIKTLGLLGDKYVELSSGSEEVPKISDGGQVQAAPATNIDRMIASGGDAVENVVAISVSLVRILERLERGEGVLGQLLAPLPEELRGDDKNVVYLLQDTLSRLDSIVASIEEGEGTVGRLLTDDELAESLSSSVGRLNSVLRKFEEGDGLAPALLHDPEMKESVRTSLRNLEESTERLTRFTRQLEESDGVLPRLLRDEEYADEVLEDLRTLLEDLNVAVGKITEGDGTVARLLDDPSVYRAIQDVVVGIEESAILRWLVRNRQTAGIEKRYEETLEEQGLEGEDPAGELENGQLPNDRLQDDKAQNDRAQDEETHTP